MARLGDGKKFKKLERVLAARGARDPKALAAYIGRKKFGNERFAVLSADGRERAKKMRVKRVRL